MGSKRVKQKNNIQQWFLFFCVVSILIVKEINSDIDDLRETVYVDGAPERSSSWDSLSVFCVVKRYDYLDFTSVRIKTEFLNKSSNIIDTLVFFESKWIPNDYSREGGGGSCGQ